MKKKGLFITLLLLVAIVCAVAMTGCSLVKLNEERQANRAIATVTQTINLTNQKAIDALNKLGITDYTISIDISRRELISNANYTINYYSQMYQAYGLTYSYDYADVLDDTKEAMLSEKYYIIKGIEKLLNNGDADRIDNMYMVCESETYLKKHGHKITTEGVLTMSEWYSAVQSVDETMNSLLKDYLSDEEDDIRNEEISNADDQISEAYEKGYFFDSVAVAKKVTEEEGTSFATGLYQDSFIVSSSSDDEEETKEVNYEKVYAQITLKKSGAEDIIVYRPVTDTNLTLTEVEDADFIGKYISSKEATVSYTGRVYAEVTEENDKGYTLEEKTSEKVAYKAVTARSAYSEPEEETLDYLKEDLYRYASKATWDAFKATWNTEKGEYDAENTEWVAYMTQMKANNADVRNIDDICDNMHTALSALYGEIFISSYTGSNSTEKEAYRQLRNTLSSANIGYVEKNPGEDSDNYLSYTYYGGLYPYYDEQFMSQVLSAVEYELGQKVVITNNDISNKYISLVLQDKVKYDSKGYTAQLEEFFKDSDSSISDLSGIYYVPMDALKNSTYEIDPSDKAYAPLFTLDEEGKVVSYNETYVTKIDDKYTMKYLYEGVDAEGNPVYTINAFFIGHILFNFDNDEDVADYVSGLNSDYSDEMLIAVYQTLIEDITTTKQNLEYTEKGGETLEDVFATDENGNLVKESVQDVLDTINEAIKEQDFETARSLFLDFMTEYNDDSGAISNSGYLITPGDIDPGFMADFTATARALYYGLLAEGKAPEGNALATSYTSYGLHYEFITFAPFYQVSLIDIGNGVYALDINTELNMDGDTHYNTIGSDLRDDAIEKAYSDWKEPFTKDVVASASTVNEKVYKALVEEVSNK